MRVMAKIMLPVESGNQGVKDGTIGKLFQAAGERWKRPIRRAIFSGSKPRIRKAKYSGSAPPICELRGEPNQRRRRVLKPPD